MSCDLFSMLKLRPLRNPILQGNGRSASGNPTWRSPMRPIDDPSSLTPDERLAEASAILAGWPCQ